MTNPIRAELLAQALPPLLRAGILPEEAHADARALLLHALGITREEFALRPDAPVDAVPAARYAERIARRARREPVAYIMRSRWFYGLEFVVTPDVLIPRPETELLVDAALAHLRANPHLPHHVADIGTGSGCVAVAVAVHAPTASVWASDLSADALMVARRNAEHHAVANIHNTNYIHFVQGDLLAPVTQAAPFTVIVSNPPYIAPAGIATLAPEVRWEPTLALNGGADGFHFYHLLAQEAPACLAPGGLLAVEVGQGQADTVAELWREAGLVDVQVTNDYAGIGRVVSGIKPVPA